MAKRKTQYEIDCEELRRRGYRPEGMTIRQIHEALHGKVDGESLMVPLGAEDAKNHMKTSSESKTAGSDVVKPAKVACRGKKMTQASVETPKKVQNGRKNTSAPIRTHLFTCQMALF